MCVCEAYYMETLPAPSAHPTRIRFGLTAIHKPKPCGDGEWEVCAGGSLSVSESVGLTGGMLVGWASPGWACVWARARHPGSLPLEGSRVWKRKMVRVLALSRALS